MFLEVHLSVTQKLQSKCKLQLQIQREKAGFL